MQPSTRPPSAPPLMARLASWKLWAASAALLVPFAWVFFASSAPFAIPEVHAACGQAPPDMRFFTSGDDVARFLDGCGPDGRAAYRNMQLADIFYPAIVGIFQASSLSLAIRRLRPSPGRALWLVTLPLAASAFDYLENALAWLAIANFPDPVATSHLLGVASAAKTTASWASGLLLIAAVLAIAGRAVGARLSTDTTPPAPSERADERAAVGSTP